MNLEGDGWTLDGEPAPENDQESNVHLAAKINADLVVVYGVPSDEDSQFSYERRNVGSLATGREIVWNQYAKKWRILMGSQVSCDRSLLP